MRDGTLGFFVGKKKRWKKKLAKGGQKVKVDVFVCNYVCKVDGEMVDMFSTLASTL